MKANVDFYIRQGDVIPSIRGTLRDEAGDVPDLESATGAVFRMRHERSGVMVVTDGEVLLDTGTGAWEYQWAEDDTSRTGIHHAVVQVIFPSDNRQTFPSHANIVVDVAPALD